MNTAICFMPVYLFGIEFHLFASLELFIFVSKTRKSNHWAAMQLRRRIFLLPFAIPYAKSAFPGYPLQSD